jgi:hypothetical protein
MGSTQKPIKDVKERKQLPRFAIYYGSISRYETLRRCSSNDESKEKGSKFLRYFCQLLQHFWIAVRTAFDRSGHEYLGSISFPLLKRCMLKYVQGLSNQSNYT